jgi:hypothetical protein
VGVPYTECASGAGRYDPLTGLCWEEPPSGGELDWDSAVAYCNALSIGGFDDWRLPMIQELVSLIRGCMDCTDTGDLAISECGVTDPDCLIWDPCWDECGTCEELAGPDDDPAGCFWDPALSGVCITYWSASSCEPSTYAWIVYFQLGGVYVREKVETEYFRCVR